MYLSKYSASGNDFLIFHHFKKRDLSTLARRVCDRFDGVGADGLIALLPHPKLDFEWQFFNSDGSEASMCGNGSRAAGLYAYENGLSDRKIRFLSLFGEIGVEIFEDGVESELGSAKIVEKSVDELGLEWMIIDSGVPHLVTMVESLDSISKESLRELRVRYNANVNVGILEDGILKIRTFERGVEDETNACGTGMVALFLYARLKKIIDSESFEVMPKSGEILRVRGSQTNLFFKGRVKKVFDTILE